MGFATYVIRDEFVNVCLCDNCWIEWAGGLFVMGHDGGEAVDFFFGVGDEFDFPFGNERIVKHGGLADVVWRRRGNLRTSDE